MGLTQVRPTIRSFLYLSFDIAVRSPSFLIERVTAQCNQTNKKFKVDASVLSRDDGEPLTEDDVTMGSQLLMEYNKKSWPVTVIKIDESNSNGEFKNCNTCSRPFLILKCNNAYFVVA